MSVTTPCTVCREPAAVNCIEAQHQQQHMSRVPTSSSALKTENQGHAGLVDRAAAAGLHIFPAGQAPAHGSTDSTCCCLERQTVLAFRTAYIITELVGPFDVNPSAATIYVSQGSRHTLGHQKQHAAQWTFHTAARSTGGASQEAFSFLNAVSLKSTFWNSQFTHQQFPKHCLHLAPCAQGASASSASGRAALSSMLPQPQTSSSYWFVSILRQRCVHGFKVPNGSTREPWAACCCCMQCQLAEIRRKPCLGDMKAFIETAGMRRNARAQLRS